jgi:hypothetical protein
VFVAVLAAGPGAAIARNEHPPPTKAPNPSSLPSQTRCTRSAGNWLCEAPDGSNWTCSSNSDGSLNSNDCACLSGCKKPAPSTNVPK